MRRKLLLSFGVVIFLVATPRATAQSPSSASYQIPESSFSSGSSIDSESASYSGRFSAGDLAVGFGSSTSYNAVAGFISPSDEYLELVVQSTNIDLGILTPTSTGSGSGNFYVRSYINGSYVVQTASTSMASGSGEVIDPLSPSATPTQGSEEFGINLVENTLESLGLDPSPDPDANFANGIAATGYDTDGEFKYTQGDVIARSSPTGLAWGRTFFTISYIANVSSITPAGLYEVDHDIVLVSTF
jgi:hypothetical protein